MKKMTEVWSSPSGPILTATTPWENSAVYQPWVIYEGNSFFRMWYSAGWDTPGVGYAECHGDPTVAANWIKPSSTVWWQGVDFNAVIKVNGLYYFFTTYQNQIYSAWSDNPRRPAPWLNTRSILSAGASPALDSSICGPSPVIDGDEFDLFYVGAPPPTSPLTYRQFLARSTSTTMGGNKLVKDQHGPLSTLQISPNGTYNITANIQKVGNNWHAWPHCSLVGVGKSDIYHAYSSDKINWTYLNGGQPAIPRMSLWDPSSFDQVADCCVVECDDLGMSYAFYDAVNNKIGSACIIVSSMAGPLSSICPL